MDATTIIPGYTIISQLLLQNFGVDAATISRVIEVDDYDTLFNSLMDWAAAQRMTKTSRELKVITVDETELRDREHDPDYQDEEPETVDETGLFNFEKWNSKNPLIYKPNFYTKIFTHNGHWFQWKVNRRENQFGEGWDKIITIRSLGRNSKPIKELLHTVKSWSLTKEIRITQVYRSSTKSASGSGTWLRQFFRPSRPLSTVALDMDQKAKIVVDINEYLQPATSRWYSVRGIPYRRGYLFHGPPGTGKTSLSFALAGIFGLAIYCVSLSETGLTESDLASLFGALPDRCIVLLEDIDTAGLRRDGASENGDDDDESDSDDGEEVKPETKADSGNQTSSSHRNNDGKKKTKSKVAAKGKKSKSLISLAGLLNIINGTASKEGRVLIMTTNCPENLDSALIRPGRVDLKVGFTLATNDQIRDIFDRMYNAELDFKSQHHTPQLQLEAPRAVNIATFGPNPWPKPSSDDGKFLALCLRRPEPAKVSPRKLQELATQFAESFPNEIFSPAEIQGYLLTKKMDPERAVNEVGQWKDEQLEAEKKKKGKRGGKTLDRDSEDEESKEGKRASETENKGGEDEDSTEGTRSGETEDKESGEEESKKGEAQRGTFALLKAKLRR
ncbi:P-loop containing nucleoside triphosphate hydrolase protein [Paraphoma chrysanthemicola]|uniref:P-loop containing nucleoside triphosphate hydrolase protein n=1 Tax=Paraphoma chrysanthemicola TaxID=798071 RepID=A0A8K0VV88_9PLEO|nr:P-loop containing nucleoside triphosphate hydrolase protein [Paraphoma chrysanthemicola]